VSEKSGQAQLTPSWTLRDASGIHGGGIAARRRRRTIAWIRINWPRDAGRRQGRIIARARWRVIARIHRSFISGTDWGHASRAGWSVPRTARDSARSIRSNSSWSGRNCSGNHRISRSLRGRGIGAAGDASGGYIASPAGIAAKIHGGKHCEGEECEEWFFHGLNCFWLLTWRRLQKNRRQDRPC